MLLKGQDYCLKSFHWLPLKHQLNAGGERHLINGRKTVPSFQTMILFSLVASGLAYHQRSGTQHFIVITIVLDRYNWRFAKDIKCTKCYGIIILYKSDKHRKYQDKISNIFYYRFKVIFTPSMMQNEIVTRNKLAVLRKYGGTKLYSSESVW